ncbi:TonB-dependent receptor [Thalassotalea ponticola]|uniref:TonB-dependent receptor n=1 Tax=Thalassotalea ponticola TaxID=1523392 RepID=UPI0025B53AFA|nr:TonB-dependent receptor [Thalassotalea ponticola]MDN3651542.1 TonB-dependent receptor [Thalassotalea ponticola]
MSNKTALAGFILTSALPFSGLAQDTLLTNEDDTANTNSTLSRVATPDLQFESTNQQAFETIVVTGDYRRHSLQQNPSSLSVLSEADIDSRQAQNLDEVVISVPNVNFAGGTNRARYYQIRGIGERSQFNEPINPSVGVIIDDVDFTGVGGIASMFDVEQVEVFKGPQGTKFGANALAGVVNINTNDPSDSFEGRLRLMLSNFDGRALGMAISAPINEQLAYRMALEHHQSDGFNVNTYLQKQDTNRRDELTGRVKFRYRASDDLTVDLAGFYFDFNNGYDAFSLDNTRKTLSDQPGFDQQTSKAARLKLNYQGWSTGDAVVLLSHADSDIDYGYDEDWSNPLLCEVFNCLAPSYSSTDYYFRQKQLTSAEFRLLSKPNKRLFNQTTDWLTGLYYRSENNHLLRQYSYAETDFYSQYDTESTALFFQLDSYLSQRLTLTTGLRIEQRDLNYGDSNALYEQDSESMLGTKLVLAYTLNQHLYYLSYNRGFKAGGVNTDGTLPDPLRRFSAEQVDNVEFGLKSQWFDGDAYTRIALFHMNRSDMQVQTYDQISRPDGSAEFLSYIDNAASGVNQGVELELGWSVNNQLTWYGALGYLDSYYQDFISITGIDLDGREQAHAPNYQFSIGVNYDLSDRWLVNLGIDHRSDFYFSDSHSEKSTDMLLLNGSVTYTYGDSRVKFWLKNITDDVYQTRGFYFGNDPRDGYQNNSYYQFGAPRQFGVSVDYQF